MAISIDFVADPYPPQGGTKKSAAPVTKMAMLFFYSGLLCEKRTLESTSHQKNDVNVFDQSPYCR